MNKNPLVSSIKVDNVTSSTQESTSGTQPAFADLAAAAESHGLLGQAEGEERSITSNPIQT